MSLGTWLTIGVIVVLLNEITTNAGGLVAQLVHLVSEIALVIMVILVCWVGLVVGLGW